MHTLIYSSRSSGPSRREVLRDILAVSRRRNANAGVTGRLLYSGKAFLQVLEGKEGVVRATFARIERDPRHVDLEVLVDEPSPARRFGEWSMGFTHLDEATLDVTSTSLADALRDGRAASLLLGLHEGEEHPPAT